MKTTTDPTAITNRQFCETTADMPGALVISLDLELMWGVRDLPNALRHYRQRLAFSRQMVPRVLELFSSYEIAATWAVVGFLFAGAKSQLQFHSPKARPRYRKASLDPYAEATGETEAEDPLHFASDLVRQILRHRRQEIATHTFSHYYCLAEGQTGEAFSSDLDSAIQIAKEHGVIPRSIVFPRNQHNSEYDRILVEKGILAYRGNQLHPAHVVDGKETLPHRRLFRLFDSFLDLSGPCLTSWHRIMEGSSLCNVPASRYLRHCSGVLNPLSPFQVRRVCKSLLTAARERKIFHLWWHTHDFEFSPCQSLQGLEEVLKYFSRLREQHSMLSLNMLEVSQLATETAGLRNDAKTQTAGK